MLAAYPLLTVLLEAVREASALISADAAKPRIVSHKSDGSPVTQTDARAESIITAKIRAVSPYAIVAEEELEAGLTPTINPDEPFFLIDALDGTRDFIKGGTDYTVNIALVVAREPVLGVIRAPASGVTWFAAQGYGAFRQDDENPTCKLAMREPPADGVHLLGGKRASEPVVLEPFIGAQTVAGREQRSSSLKFCLLAEGQADLYPRLMPTSEWDTAAGDIIVREAGGVVLDLESGQPITYGKQDKKFVNGGFIAGNRRLFLPTISTQAGL